MARGGDNSDGRRSARAAGRVAPAGGGYSRFVSIAKPSLLAAAATVLGVLVALPQFYNMSERFRVVGISLVEQAIDGHRLTNARFTGTDRNGNPYTLSAQALVQGGRLDDPVRLSELEGDFTTADGAWIAVSAAAGSFVPKRRVAELEGGVHLFHDFGYDLETDRVRVDFTQGVANSETRVVGRGPAGHFEAAGFRIRDDGRRIDLTGPARVVFNPRAAEERAL